MQKTQILRFEYFFVVYSQTYSIIVEFPVRKKPLTYEILRAKVAA